MARVDGRVVAVLAFSGLLWVGIGAATGHTPLPAQAASFREGAALSCGAYVGGACVVCIAFAGQGMGDVAVGGGYGAVLRQFVCHGAG